MRKGLAVAAGIATTVIAVACASDRILAPAPMRFSTTSSLSVMNHKTHQLEAVALPPAEPGVSASLVGSGADAAVVVASGSPGVATAAGYVSYAYSDSLHHPNKVVLFYRPGGGPPASAYHFRDTQLIATTAFSWAHISGGWYMSQAKMSLVTPSGTTLGSYTLTSQYTQTTRPCSKTVTTNCGPPQIVRGNVGPVQKIVGYAALGLAYSCAPTDALAQWGFHFADCFGEWLVYGSSVALLYGAAGATLDGPGIALIAGSYGLAVKALKDLVDCMVSHDMAFGGGGGGGGGGSGGAGGGGSNASCDNGGLDCPVLWTQ